MVRLHTITNHISSRTAASYQQMFERVSKLVDFLASCVQAQRISGSYFDEVESELGALPLATADFAVACCRLRNARCSALQGEFGAASYELRLLARSLFAP